jgi:hypothetical protein
MTTFFIAFYKVLSFYAHKQQRRTSKSREGTPEKTATSETAYSDNNSGSQQQQGPQQQKERQEQKNVSKSRDAGSIRNMQGHQKSSGNRVPTSKGTPLTVENLGAAGLKTPAATMIHETRLLHSTSKLAMISWLLPRLLEHSRGILYNRLTSSIGTLTITTCFVTLAASVALSRPLLALYNIARPF